MEKLSEQGQFAYFSIYLSVSIGFSYCKLLETYCSPCPTLYDTITVWTVKRVFLGLRFFHMYFKYFELSTIVTHITFYEVPKYVTFYFKTLENPVFEFFFLTPP